MKRYLPLALIPLLAACVTPDGRVTEAECAQALLAVEALRMEHEAGKVGDDSLRRAEIAAGLYCASVTVTTP
jgi:hypothetical protein